MKGHLASENSNSELDNGDETSLEHKNLFNYFPNQPTKQIDYVIVYKESENTKNAEKSREKFFNTLETKGFEIYTIKKQDEGEENVKIVYKLLHCSLEKLMEEAERIQLELPLKDVLKSFINFLQLKIF